MAKRTPGDPNLRLSLLNDIEDPKERERVVKKLKKVVANTPPPEALVEHRRQIVGLDDRLRLQLEALAPSVKALLDSLLPDGVLRLDARVSGIEVRGLTQFEWLWLKIRLQAEHEGVSRATIISRAIEQGSACANPPGGDTALVDQGSSHTTGKARPCLDRDIEIEGYATEAQNSGVKRWMADARKKYNEKHPDNPLSPGRPGRDVVREATRKVRKERKKLQGN